MEMWICDFENCGKPSVRTYGECIICERHLCATHLVPEYHTCPKREVCKRAVPQPNLEDIHLLFSLIRTRHHTILQLEKQDEKKSHII